jgi:phosphohistidine phosphatase
MLLYIMRHGIACEHGEWKGSDFDRPLTAEGSERTRKVVNQLKKAGELNVDAVWSSPLTRARQTAEIAGAALRLGVKQVPELESGAQLSNLLLLAKKEPLPQRLLWVGHEPDCGAIVGELIDDPAGDYALKRAGIAKLEGEFKHGGMKLIWIQAPKDVLED